jgi:predicted transcriptional regulator
MNNISTSYLLWLCWFAGFAGLHRIYNKKFLTGLLWFFTWGLFGVGQVIDLLLIPSMVEEHNLKVRRRLGLSPTGIPLNPASAQSSQPFAPFQPAQAEFNSSQLLSQQEIMIKLAQAAQKKGGKLSVTQAVIETGITFEQVETTLQEMVKKGYVMVDNHPTSGVVIYDFLELS